MMLSTGSATAQSSVTQPNLQAVPTCDSVKEDLQKIGKLFREVYDTFKEGRKRRRIVRKPRADFIRNAEDQFRDFKIDNKPRNAYLSTLTVTSEGISELKEFFVATATAVTGVMKCKEVKDFTKGTLKTMGSAHLIGAALLVVVHLLERWEDISKNKEECLDLLEDMANLVSYLYQISERSTEISKIGNCHLQEIISECMDTITDGYDLIWSTLTARKRKRFFNAKTEKEELAKLKHELDNKYRKLMGQIMIDLSIFAPYTRPHEFRFPSEAVGLFDEVTRTINQMEWQGDEKALGVVLHGHSGSGKTTLGDAVCSGICVNRPTGFSDGRCAIVRLFRGMNPFEIMEAQRILINDLENKNFKPNSTNEGRNKIGDILRQIPAFIYIDNVEGDKELKDVLPCDLNEAKKLRLLLTCRDSGHCMSLNLSRPLVFHRIKPLSEEAATEFIKKNLEKEAWFNTTISEEIADMCGGIPLLLYNIVMYLFHKGEEGLEIVKSEHKNYSGKFGELVNMLGLKELEEEERDALLDILCFFKQENGGEVERIVRTDILDKLACKSLVEKTHQEPIKFVDVLSYITKEEARKTRFTTEEQIKEFLKAKDRPRRLKGMKNIKGISVPPAMEIDIPHILLDHMQDSVRVLKLGMKVMITGECEERFEKLIYLDCRPSIHFETPKLRCLRLFSDFPNSEVNLSTFWQAEFENFQELSEIQISGSSLKTLPNGLYLLKELKVLKLSCCHDLDLEDLDNRFFHLSQKIELFLCDHLKSKMERIIPSMLPSLKCVSISCHVNPSI